MGITNNYTPAQPGWGIRETSPHLLKVLNFTKIIQKDKVLKNVFKNAKLECNSTMSCK